MSNDPQRNERRNDWLTSNVLTSILIFLVIQFGTAIWWASKMTADLGYVQKMLINSDRDRYTKNDAEKDFAARDVYISGNSRRIERLEDRFQKLPK